MKPAEYSLHHAVLNDAAWYLKHRFKFIIWPCFLLDSKRKQGHVINFKKM
jgi:hypothetical protein